VTAVRRLPVRVISGLSIGFVASLAAVLGGAAWSILIFAFFPLAYRELLALMSAKQIYPSKVTVWLFAPTFYVLAYLGLERHFDIVVTLGLIFTFSWLIFRSKMATISDIGGTILMFFYLGFLPAHFIVLRNLGQEASQPVWAQPGVGYIFLILFTVSACDVFAYYGGKRFGKKPLSPQISPKKTIEGSVVGMGSAVLIAAVSAMLFGIHWGHGAVLGVLISLVAQVGDLSESLIKRDAGQKDSGSLIPGHGGILDRTDSYIFAGAVAYYYINWFILHQGVAKEVLEFLHYAP